MKKNIIIIILLLSIVNLVFAQNRDILGKIIDGDQQAVEFVTVVLQIPETGYSDVILTDSLGQFRFTKVEAKESFLIFQHILFETDTLKVIPENNAPLSVVLRSKEFTLKDIQVIAERPLVRMEGNVLSYDAKMLASTRSVLNAYEIVKEIPGVMEVEDKLSLVGTDKLNVVINGQITTMSMDQIVSMLKSTPASSIKSVEVMYNPPAKYNVRGALINVVLDKAVEHIPFTGEMMVGFAQSVNASNSDRLSLSYNKSNLRVDLFANINSGKNWQEQVSSSHHSLKERVVEIEENTKARGNYINGDLRLGIDYQFRDKSNLIFAYYTDLSKSIIRWEGNTAYRDTISYKMRSMNKRRNTDQLHNGYLQYTKDRFQIGAEYTFYSNPSKQNYTDSIFTTSSVYTDYINHSTQRISRWSAFVNHGVAIGADFVLTYGFNGGYNLSNSNIDYKFREGDVYIEKDSLSLIGRQKEYTSMGFVEGMYKFSEKLSANLSLKLEYFQADYINNGVKISLWDDWTLYPNLSFTYNPTDRNMFQFNFSSDKRYPSYWAINPETSSLSSYSQIDGNPELKPSKVFRGQLMYMRDRKYTLMAFVQYTPDYFVQLPHMSEDELKLIYRYENYDYLLRSGIMISANFRFGTFYRNKLMIQGLRSDERINDFYGSSFDNTSYSAVVMFDNTFNITKNIIFQFDAFFQSNARQGVYRIGPLWSLDSRLKWNINNDMYVVAKYTNIVRNSMPRPLRLEYGNQYQVTKHRENSKFGLSFVWTFGSYKVKKYKEVDDSRFGK